MSIHARLIVTLLVLTAGSATYPAAQAADSTRYISITGSNANPCTLAQPCRTLQRAIQIVPAGGEIRVLDSGFYGNNATINKSLTISGNGNTVYFAAALTVSKAGAVVALRGLVLNGQGTMVNGIVINKAGAVHIERCVVHNFLGQGIEATADSVRLYIVDTISRDNGAHGLIVVAPTSRVTVDNARFENNLTGILIGYGNATINRSVVSGNQTDGFSVQNGAEVTIESSVVRGNFTGLSVLSGAFARISNSTFTENTTGIANGGTVRTRENNTVDGNGSEWSGNALTPFTGL